MNSQPPVPAPPATYLDLLAALGLLVGAVVGTVLLIVAVIVVMSKTEGRSGGRFL